MFGVPMRALPEVRDSTADFGETDLQGALKRPIPICGVMGDSQASLFAHRCFAPGMAKVTLGSGSSVLLNIGPKLRPSGEGAVSTIAWTHRGEPTYSFEGIINYSAATIAWLKDQLGLIRDISEAEPAACGLADNGGVYLVPAFAGLERPHWSPDARAAIVGMSGAHKPQPYPPRRARIDRLPTPRCAGDDAQAQSRKPHHHPRRRRGDAKSLSHAVHRGHDAPGSIRPAHVRLFTPGRRTGGCDGDGAI